MRAELIKKDFILVNGRIIVKKETSFLRTMILLNEANALSKKHRRLYDIEAFAEYKGNVPNGITGQIKSMPIGCSFVLNNMEISRVSENLCLCTIRYK